MAHTKSALKRVRQSEKKRLSNNSYKSSIKTALKSFSKAVEAGDKEKATKLFNDTVKLIYKVKSKGVIHKNNASRKVSKLALKLNKLNAE